MKTIELVEKQVICYEVFDQDTKNVIRTYGTREDAEKYCKDVNYACKISGGSSTQYGVAQTVRVF